MIGIGFRLAIKLGKPPHLFRYSRLSVFSTSNWEYPIHSLPRQFLRAADTSNYDCSTHQRADVKYESSTGKPCLNSHNTIKTPLAIKDVSVVDGDKYCVQWSDGLTSTYNMNWVQEQVDRFHADPKHDRIFWTDLTEEQVRDSPDLSMPFETLITVSGGMKLALQSLYRFGILLVTQTPIHDGSGVAAIGAALGGGSVKDNTLTSVLASYRNGGSETILEHGTDGPLRTLYGSVWSTSSSHQEDGTSKADSAYGSDGLPLHTDMTYMRDPPGLQIFTMVQPARQGGESVFSDGFAVANELKTTAPGAFVMLSQTPRRYRCVDSSTGWNLQACGPIIFLQNGNIQSIRHNDLDRLPDLPPIEALSKEDMDAFYASLDKAHASWDALLAKDKFRLVMKLQPGDTMVVANQRCFHGRSSFSSSRAVMGCYVSQDELSSRFRQEGFEDLY